MSTTPISQLNSVWSNRRAAGRDFFFGHSPVKLAALGVSALIGVSAVSGSFYTVSPTQMAGVRRMDSVISAAPVGPGLHFKLPFIDTVDRLEVSQQVLPGTISVHTVDNQEVNLRVKLLYSKPPESVFYLLYKVGRAGVGDIDSQIEGTIEDRTGKIFAQQNTLEISQNRTVLSNDIKAILKTDLKDLYKVDVRDFQIDEIDYTAGFNEYNERAMQSKAQAIAAANKVAEVKSQGDQMRATADANAYAVKTAADAEEYKNRAEGQGQADAIKAQRALFQSDDAFVRYTAAKHWDGRQPMVSGAGSTTLLQGVLGAVGGGEPAGQSR